MIIISTASINNNQVIVRELINANASLNIQDINGRTALIDASDYARFFIVGKLIYAGANLNIQDIFGKTALVYGNFTLTFFNISTPY